MIIYFIAILFWFLGVVLYFMFMQADSFDKKKIEKPISDSDDDICDDAEDRFTRLMHTITPSWYWYINHEYSDFTQATIKKMAMMALVTTPMLFERLRRCSNLNAAVYKYYDILKKRCLKGERVALSDIDVIHLRLCFREFALEAYLELVDAIWPHLKLPQVSLFSSQPGELSP